MMAYPPYEEPHDRSLLAGLHEAHLALLAAAALREGITEEAALEEARNCLERHATEAPSLASARELVAEMRRWAAAQVSTAAAWAVIYLAWSGEYDDRRLEAAFTQREDAEALELSDDVEEVPLRNGPAEVRDWHGMIWYLGRPLQTPEETPKGNTSNPYPYSGGPQRKVYDGQPKRLEVSKGMPNSVGYGTVWVWGWDLELVLAEGNRIYREETT